ncbi:MAG: Gfo/Idh/MocA family oxidoreductase [Planctomycetota bacterium]
MHRVTRRDFVRTGLAAGAVLALPGRSLWAAGANEQINIGFIGCGGRGKQLMGMFDKIAGVSIIGLCDPDESALTAPKKKYAQAKTWADPRALLDDKDIDAVVVAACNHWHCLAAIWAMEAGKDVYVEKPLSHSQWEGRQTVAAAKKYGKICQVGTQQRSDPMQAEIKKFLHEEKALGNIQSARVNRYGIRAPIGKRDKPLEVPATVNYDVWLGPAQDEPICRDNLQYDWHWVWNTGSGEMGNWGVHVLDDLRNNVFCDKVSLPKRIFGGGGRVAYNDAGETPNVHFVYFDTGSIPVVIGLSNIPAAPGAKKSSQHPGPGSGYIAYCEGGRFEGQRGKAAAFDKQGKVIKEFKGNSGNSLHQQNFIDAVRRRDPSILNTPVQMGHDSTGWCNLANIAFRAGGAFSMAEAKQASDTSGRWDELVGEMQELLAAHGMRLDGPEIKLSPVLEVDPQREQFVGSHAEAANRFLKREYRAPYVVPEIES